MSGGLAETCAEEVGERECEVECGEERVGERGRRKRDGGEGMRGRGGRRRRGGGGGEEGRGCVVDETKMHDALMERSE